MDEEQFKRICPNLFQAINNCEKTEYEIYGIRFKARSILTWYEIRDKVEDTRCMLVYKFNHLSPEEKYSLVILN